MTTLLDEIIETRLCELELQIAQLSRIGAHPGIGRIKVHQKNGKLYYCIVGYDENGRVSEFYVNPDKMEQAVLINEKQMSGYLLKLCLQERDALRSFRDSGFAQRRERIFERFSKRSALVISDCLRSEAEKARLWEAEAFETNDYEISENDARITDRGEIVRSKLECLVANRLFAMGLPYRYECRLYLHGADKVRYPDFTVKSPYTGKIIYVEVFGMMDQPEYAKAAFAKINLYAREGIVIGDNFLPVFEYPGVPFDPKAFTVSMERLLKLP